MKNTGAPYGEEHGLSIPFSKYFCNCFFNSCNSRGDNLITGRTGGWAPGTRLISNYIPLVGGSSFGNSSLTMSSNSVEIPPNSGSHFALT